MPVGTCPQCSSTNLEKERINGSSTGDYICMSCKYTDHPNQFKDKYYTKEQMEELIKNSLSYLKNNYDKNEFNEVLMGLKEHNLIEKVIKYLLRYIDIVNQYRTLNDLDIDEIIYDVLHYGCSSPFQDRKIILKNIDGFGAVLFDHKIVASTSKKIFPLMSAKGDFCWGYKHGSSTLRTALVILNECLFEFDENASFYIEMASTFADDILFPFTQNENAILEEIKVVQWVHSYIDDYVNYDNLVKKVCDELDVTQKELAEMIEVSKPSIERWSQSGHIPKSSEKLLKLFLENKKLKNELNELKIAIQTITKYM